MVGKGWITIVNDPMVFRPQFRCRVHPKATMMLLRCLLGPADLPTADVPLNCQRPDMLHPVVNKFDNACAMTRTVTHVISGTSGRQRYKWICLAISLTNKFCPLRYPNIRTTRRFYHGRRCSKHYQLSQERPHVSTRCYSTDRY